MSREQKKEQLEQKIAQSEQKERRYAIELLKTAFSHPEVKSREVELLKKELTSMTDKSPEINVFSE